MEIFRHQSLEHIDSDRWAVNFILCALTYVFLIMAMTTDLSTQLLLIMAAIFYFFQFIEAFFSNTKYILGNLSTPCEEWF
jgi:hypothetical protein